MSAQASRPGCCSIARNGGAGQPTTAGADTTAPRDFRPALNKGCTLAPRSLSALPPNNDPSADGHNQDDPAAGHGRQLDGQRVGLLACYRPISRGHFLFADPP